MRLLHWNIHMWRDVEGGDNKQAVAELIDRVAPDVVSLVEVDEPWGRPEGLRWLASELGYRWVFVPAFEYRGEGGFGNALLARPPIQSAQQWQLLSPRLYAGDEPSEPRAVLLLAVAMPLTIRVYSEDGQIQMLHYSKADIDALQDRGTARKVRPGDTLFTAGQRDFAETLQRIEQEEAQPHAFAAALPADAAESVVPIAAANERQAVRAGRQPAVQSAAAMLVQRGGFTG